MQTMEEQLTKRKKDASFKKKKTCINIHIYNCEAKGHMHEALCAPFI